MRMIKIPSILWGLDKELYGSKILTLCTTLAYLHYLNEIYCMLDYLLFAYQDYSYSRCLKSRSLFEYQTWLVVCN